jgi:hypothetical protein
VAATASRVDMILEAILPLLSAAIVNSDILPPTSSRFPDGWIITAGWPDANQLNSIRYAAEDGGYTVAVDAIEPSRISRQQWITHPLITFTDGSQHRMLARRLQRVQITAWAATDTLRDEIADAIVSAVGVDISPGQWLPLPDGTTARMEFASGPRRVDEPISEVQIKRADVLIDVDYGVYGPTLSYKTITQTEGIVDFPKLGTQDVFVPTE